MNSNKNYGGDLCKSHSARSEKEFCRVCPSNLNKKELENVYFTLLENNLDLKTTINSQREKIKILSTKVQRLTALQKTYLGKEPKECCGSKAVINEQKECIAELRKSNQNLSERVRQLNMRLCSAKQFLKRSPFQSTSRCNRCSNKNGSMSALITKRSESNLRTAVASSQSLVKDIMLSRTADNITISHEKGVQYDFCEENKCRNRIEELKRKNDELQDELSRMKENHAALTSQLERELSELRDENVRVRSGRALADERVEQLRAQLAELNLRLGSADLRHDELAVELAVERRKVAELQTRLKAADMSCRIAGALETHLANIKMVKDHTHELSDIETRAQEKPAADDGRQVLSVQSPPYKPKAAVRTKIPHNVQVEDVFKSSDDSGYTEVNKSQEVDDTKASTYVNQILLQKIADLQNQVNVLRASGKEYNKPDESLTVKQVDRAKLQVSTTRPDELQTNVDENVISESSESVVTEKKASTNIIPLQQMNIKKNDIVLSKRETLDRDSKPAGITEEDEFKQQETNSNGDSKVRENFKRFKRRIKNASQDSNTVAGNRKLSLQHSSDLCEGKNVIKTGSLDDSRINVNKDSMKRFEITNTITDGSNQKPITESNNGIANAEESFFPDNRVQSTLKETDIKGKRIIEHSNVSVADAAPSGTRTDSGSSRGTYTIDKNDSVSRLKTKPKETCLNINEGSTQLLNTTLSYKDPFTLGADVKKVSSTATILGRLAHRRKCAASEHRAHAPGVRDASPTSTECEISSLSDLPSEADDRTGLSRSPGEERPLTVSESHTATTDYGSLSEGELPYLRDATILSDGEKRLSNGMGKSRSVPVASARQLEATLAAAQQELTRCTRLTRLLRGHGRRSLDAPTDGVLA